MSLKYYDKYKKKPDIHWRNYKHGGMYRSLVDDGLEFFEEPGTVIDIGCGDGVSSYILAKMGFFVFGVDNAKEGVETAYRKCEGLPFEAKVITIEEYEKNSNQTFDYLYSLNTIEHVEDPASYVRIMERVRRFGVIITDNKHTSKSRTYHHIMFDEDDLRELFKDYKVERFHFKHPDAERLFIGVKVYAN